MEAIDKTFERQVSDLSKRITEEIFIALGGKRNGLLYRIFGPIFQLPTRRFARIAARFESDVAKLGPMMGARKALPRFSMQVVSRGKEHIPPKGPVLIVSNHPGGLDSLALVSQIPRKDITALVSDVPFLYALEGIQKHVIYVNFKAIGGMAALRTAIEHLRNGGSILLFAHGDVEPDPETMSGASETISDWSQSIEIMLRKVPETTLVIATISNVLLSRFINSPITLLRRQPTRKQKLAEFTQVIQQLLSPDKLRVLPHITFSEPIEQDRTINKQMPSIIQRATDQLQEHLKYFKN
jgi:hypothetical protein